MALKASTPADVATIQCRAASEAIEGAAISKTPPAIQAIVGICQTKRNSVRRRCGSIVTRGNIFASDSTPWISAAMIATTPEICSRMSRIGVLHTVLYGRRSRAGACQYSSVWLLPHDRSTVRAGLARPGSEDPRQTGLFRPQGRAAGESHG